MIRPLMPIVILLIISGCSAATDDGADAGTEGPDTASAAGLFAGPEGIAVADGTIYVVNANGHYDNAAGRVVYGEGFIQALDSQTLEPTVRGDLPCQNPQYVLPGDGGLLVVCSGRLEADGNGAMLPVTEGAVLRLDAATLAVTQQVVIPAGEPAADAGFPGNVAVDPDSGTLYVGSGSGPFVYAVDLDAGTAQPFALPRPDALNELVVPAWWQGRLFATSFADGLLYELDPVDGTVAGTPLDVTETDEIEGPIDVAVGDGGLYIVHTLSTRVVFADPDAGTVTPLFSAGAAANRIRLHNGALWVVNSMDNNLSRHDLATGKTTTPFAALPPGTNPWELSFANDRAFVTGYLSNQLFALDIATGETVEVVE